MAEHNAFGAIGEQIAVDYLLKKGYSIQYRNYRYLKAEIDIIAQKNNTLIIVEVKARSTNFIDDVVDLIPPKKIKLLVMAADYYVISNNLDIDVRFDIVMIKKNKNGFDIDHMEDAFYHF